MMRTKTLSDERERVHVRDVVASCGAQSCLLSFAACSVAGGGHG